MAVQDNSEFKYALREIALKASNLESPYDRVRCTQWIKKLTQMSDDDLELIRKRNEYAQYLRIQVRNKCLHGIFKASPPESRNLASLSENLGNMMSQKIPSLPRVGPLAPMLQHQASDGTAVVAAKEIDGGVFCYMSVTPKPFR
ncbi:hypothetical protein CBL_09279 [Carabus blaptoides fortunei]